MSDHDTSEPSPDDAPTSPPAVRKWKKPKDGIQFDRWGIKADIIPARVGEPDPHSWKDVGAFVNAHLQRIAVDLCGLIADSLHAMRKLVRGAGQMPPSKQAKVERAHDVAERAETLRQERHEAGNVAELDGSVVSGELVDLLAEVRSRGVVVEIRELPDGSPAIVMIGPQHTDAAEKIIAASLPVSGSTSASAGIPIANILPGRLVSILTGRGLTTAGQLAEMSAETLGDIPGVGEKYLSRIRSALTKLGLSLDINAEDFTYDYNGTLKSLTRLNRLELDELFEPLDSLERAVLSLRFGLDGEAPMSQREIGLRLDRSRVWAREIEIQAISKLQS